MNRSLTILAITAAALLVIVAIPAHAQTAPNLSQELNLGMLSLIPEPVVDPTVDPPGNFMNVIPSQFDPGKTYLVQSSWLSGLGCPTNAIIAVPNSSFTAVDHTEPAPPDAACPTGDPGDLHNEGLLLAKTGPTGNFASATADLVNVKGVSVTEIGYDIRKSGGPGSPLGSHCGAGAPRFDVVTSDGDVHFIGCNSPPAVIEAISNDWVRLRWTAAQAFPPISPTDTVQRIVIVFDEGTDTGADFFGAAILDNIDVNGQLVGRGPTNGK